MLTPEFTCQDLIELVTEYLEDALPPEVRAAFEHHISECASCSEYLAQIRLTISITGAIATTDDLSPEAVNTLLDAFRDWTKKRPVIDG